MKKEVVKYLERYWNYYIHENYVYHAFPRILHDEIQEKGINPKKNHLAKYKKELEQLWKILEARSLTPQFFEFGRLLTLARKSLGEHSLDFASSIEEAKSFNESWALAEGIHKFTSHLFGQFPLLSLLSPEESKLVTRIHHWSEKWKSMEFFLVKVRLSDPAFRESLFQFVGSKDQESSLAVGPWKYFKKQVVKKTGKKSKDITIADVEIALEKYHPFLVAKRPFSVRLYKKVLKEGAEVVKN
jgi:hypothetical protein